MLSAPANFRHFFSPSVQSLAKVLPDLISSACKPCAFSISTSTSCPHAPCQFLGDACDLVKLRGTGDDKVAHDAELIDPAL